MTTADTSRKIEYRDLDDIHANPANPKAHDQSTIGGSISRFGIADPVVVDGRTNLLVSGHGRTDTLRAMRERGESPPDGVVLDEDGAWQVPVVVGWSSRSDTEASAALIALNRTTELGGWVDDSLLDLLDGLTDDGESMEGLIGVGYGGEDMEMLRRKLESMDAPRPEAGAVRGGLATNPWEEWEGAGLSDYDSTTDHTPYQTIRVHFSNDEDVRDFADRLGLSVTDRTKFTWWPPQDDVTSLDVVGDVE